MSYLMDSLPGPFFTIYAKPLIRELQFSHWHIDAIYLFVSRIVPHFDDFIRQITLNLIYNIGAPCIIFYNFNRMANL